MILPHPGLPLRGPYAAFLGDEAILARALMILRTRRGSLPWAPEFGIDLESFLGRATTGALASELRWRVEQALNRWLTGVRVCSVKISFEDSAETPVGLLPGEGALMALGLTATLHMTVDLAVEGRHLTLEASL